MAITIHHGTLVSVALHPVELIKMITDSKSLCT